MTGDLVKAMLGCGKPIVTAVDGVAVGAGAIIVMASDIRIATPEAKTAFLFTRVGLAGCDMGRARSCRASSDRAVPPSCSTPAGPCRLPKASAGGFNRLVDAAALEADALDMAHRIVAGPDLRPRHHQDPVESGNGPWGSTRPSKRKPRPRRSACRRATSSAPIAPSSPGKPRCSREHDHARTERHTDTFARDRLPPADEMPDFLLQGFEYPERLNIAVGSPTAWSPKASAIAPR